jgi:bla regulator protein BlaR1
VPALIGAPLVGTPFTAGLIRPRIYLPPEVTASLGREELRHVLLHELMHVKRRDVWRALAVGLVTALYWFHPLAWIAASRLEALREQCCDRAVARRLGEGAHRYRKTLITLGARALGLEARPSPGTPGFFGRQAGLLARLRVLEHEASHRTRLRQTLTALSSALLLCVLVPVTPASSEALHRIGEALERPPGCYLLRMEVLRRIAEEDAKRGDE